MATKVLDRKLFRENKIFNFYLDHLVDDEGNEVKEYFVLEPKNLNERFVAGIAVLPIVDGKVGLLEMHRPALRQNCWEIPHGLINKFESEKAAAVRELREETGIITSVNDLVDLGQIAPDSGIIGAKLNLFFVCNCLPVERQESEFGLGKFKLFDVEEIQVMIMTSVIIDSITMVALFRYLSLLGNVNWSIPGNTASSW